MQKNDIIQTYFHRKQFVTIAHPSYQNSLSQLFDWFVEADAIAQDKSVSILPAQHGNAEIITKQSGVIAGLEEVLFLAKTYTTLQMTPLVQDGQTVNAQTTLLTISGNYTELLTYERIFLNILGRMSGIATKTNLLVETHCNASLLIGATRKTPWMLLDKKAVAVGGGLTHRLSLSDWPMIKDNHLQVLQNTLHISSEEAVSEAIHRLIAASVPFFELEVDTQKQAEAAMQTFTKEKTDKTTMALLLDNFHPNEAKALVLKCKKLPIYNSMVIEASGGITEDTIEDWTHTGVDIISLGSLTHSSPNFDFSMKFV